MLKDKAGSVRLLVFDLDGTLVDSKGDIVFSANLALASVGLSPFTEPRIVREIGRGSEYLFRQLLGQNTPTDTIDELVRNFREIYEERLIVQTKLYPGIREALGHCSGLTKVIVTNKCQVFADRLVDAFELRPHFEAVFGLEAFATRKPDPGPLLGVCRRWNQHPSHAAMIGDSVFDVIAGKSAGLLTVSALYGFGSTEELQKHSPDFAISSPHELAAIF